MEFETAKFETLCDFIKPLLAEDYQVLITSDGEGVFGVRWCKPEWEGGDFRLFTEDCKDGVYEFRLDGDLIEYVAEEDEE